MISNVKVAAVQMSCSDDREENIAKAERMVRQAASDGANVILLPELFELPYFCQEKITITIILPTKPKKTLP